MSIRGGYREMRRTTNSPQRTTAHSRAGAAIVLATLALVFPAPAKAHSRPATPDTLWTTWTVDPLLISGLLLSSCVYLFGVRTVWQRAGYGRGIPYWRAAAFLGGLLAIALALVSPLAGLSAALFSAHMAQHLILILVAAPLLVLGTPLTPFLWTLPLNARQCLSRFWKRNRIARGASAALGSALVVLIVHAVILWLWHLPALYDAALGVGGLHSLEHAAFLLTAVLFWWTVLPVTGGRSVTPGLGVLYVFVAAMQSSILGILMLLSRSPWYDSHLPHVAAWGMTPLEDQQLAGVIMWIPAGTVYALVALCLLGSWLVRLERAPAAFEQGMDH